MTIAKILLLVFFISIAVNAQQSAAHLAEQHFASQEVHFAAPAATAKTTPQAKSTPKIQKKGASATNAKTTVDLKVKTEVAANTNKNKPNPPAGNNKSVAKKPVNPPSTPSGKATTSLKPKAKPNTQAPKPKKSETQVVKPKTPVQAVKTISNGVDSKSPQAKGSIPKKIIPQKTNTVETKPKEKVQIANGKQPVKEGLPAPKKAKKVLKIVKSAAPKQAQKITTTPENCYNSIDKAGIQKLTAYLPNKVGGKLSCRNRLTCFLGENQLQRYLEAVSKDEKCKCSAKTKFVKCQVKYLTGFDLDDNPMYIYYRFSKDGELMLNEIKEVTVQFKFDEHKAKAGKSVLSWSVSAAYPAEP